MADTMTERRVSESLKAALVSYRETPGLTPVDSAHLQRWSDDDRADEVWLTIERAAQEHELAVPPHVFIREIR